MSSQKKADLSSKKICFVICPIGPAGSKERARSDQLLEHILVPVCSELGYETIRADQFPDPGLITNQIMERLVDSDLVIADLTGKNPNVFYELGVRHATGKPFIQIMLERAEVPFDIANVRTTPYSLNVDHVKKVKQDISSQIQWIQDNPQKVQNPVLLARNIESLLSGSTAEKSAGQIMSMLSNITETMNNIDQSIFKMTDRGRTSLGDIESTVDDISSTVDDIKDVVDSIESQID